MNKASDDRQHTVLTNAFIDAANHMAFDGEDRFGVDFTASAFLAAAATFSAFNVAGRHGRAPTEAERDALLEQFRARLGECASLFTKATNA